MTEFPGFPEGKVRFTNIPDPFFRELLPLIDHLGELKVTLYAFWYLDRTEGSFRYIQRENYLEDKDFMRGFVDDLDQADSTLEDALQRCVERGTFLSATLDLEGGPADFFFLNTSSMLLVGESTSKQSSLLSTESHTSP